MATQSVSSYGANTIASTIPEKIPSGELSPEQALAKYAPPPPPPVYQELTQAQKLEKERRENPTVDENGEHI